MTDKKNRPKKKTPVKRKKDSSKVAGGVARSKALTEKERKKISSNAAKARWALSQALYAGELKIGGMVFTCSVLSDETRIITQSDFMQAMGMYYSGWVSANRSEEEVAADIPQFLAFKALKPYINKHLGDLQSITVNYRTEKGATARGIKAEIIPRICEVWLDAEEGGKLGSRQKKIAANAKLIMRALAHVGIVALVDEATGYQVDRAPNALTKILEAFIAKELQPWVKTFPDEFYEELFRLRELEYDENNVSRPQYFGHLTNKIIYKRLAPAVLQELQNTTPKTPKGAFKDRFHQRLTPDLGHPKLRELMASVVTIMKLSDNYADFDEKLNKIHPMYNETMELQFEDSNGVGF